MEFYTEKLISVWMLSNLSISLSQIRMGLTWSAIVLIYF